MGGLPMAHERPLCMKFVSLGSCRFIQHCRTCLFRCEALQVDSQLEVAHRLLASGLVPRCQEDQILMGSDRVQTSTEEILKQILDKVSHQDFAISGDESAVHQDSHSSLAAGGSSCRSVIALCFAWDLNMRSHNGFSTSHLFVWCWLRVVGVGKIIAIEQEFA